MVATEKSGSTQNLNDTNISSMDRKLQDANQ